MRVEVTCSLDGAWVDDAIFDEALFLGLEEGKDGIPIICVLELNEPPLTRL